MTTSIDYMGLGIPPEVARRISSTATTLVTTGTSQATAALIVSRFVQLSTAASQTGAIASAGSTVGTEYFIFNPTATSAIIYAPVGATLNGAASSTGLTLAQNKGCILFCVARNVFFTILTA